MAKIEGVILKPGKEKAILNHHHWIFSGAVKSYPKFIDGDILKVFTNEGQLLGSGYFNSQAKIVGRMLSFNEEAAEEVVVANLKKAISLRLRFFGEGTNAYRLVNAEGDLLPGLIIDRYQDLLVLQVSTLGMKKLIPMLLKTLIEILKPKTILEKSDSPVLREEGLESFKSVLFGSNVEELVIQENGLQFLVQPSVGQKTGFFLDQREMRSQIKALSFGKKVLNCFSYTGGFSISSLSGGASLVDSVDISDKALAIAKQNVLLNKLNQHDASFFAEDAFQFLRKSPLDYDIVILDPPAFAKKAKDLIPACRGYKDINRVAMQKMPKGSLLLTCSCSYFVDEQLFQKVLFQASVEANRQVKILSKHRQAFDHPVNLCHPESEYLKSFLLYVD